MPWVNPLPPDTRSVGTGNPPGDMDGVVDALVAMGAVYNVQNPAYGFADPAGGADSTTAIQAALTAGAGKRVYLPGGTYLISSDLSVPSGTTVYGDGRSTVLMAAAGTYTGATGPNLLKVSGASHVIIRDLAFNGNSANITYGGQHNYLHGGTGVIYTQLQCIYILNSDDVAVEDCLIYNGYSSGIMAQASTDLIIQGNRLTGCGDNQVYVRALTVSPYTPCDYVTATGNIASGGAFSGIQFLGSSHITATGNVCYSNGPSAGQGNGVGSEGSSDVTITGNTCYANGIQGVNVRFTSEVGANQASSHIVVSGNTCYGHTSSDGDAGGISVSDADDVLVTDNLVYGNYWGINVCTVAMTATNIDIAGNKVRGSTAIGVRLAPGAVSAYNITGNKVSGGTSTGIYTDVQAWVKDNTAGGNTGTFSYGIQLDTGAGGSQVQNNTIYDNGSNGIMIGGTGVAGCDIRDNYITNVAGTQPVGVYEATGNGPNRLVNNRILKQATAPYVLSSAASSYSDEAHPLETPVTQPAALFLNGTSNYATAPDAASLDTTGSVSMEMWLNPQAATQEAFWTPAGKSAQYWFEGISTGALSVSFNIMSGGTNRGSGYGTVTQGRMNHVAGTFTSSTGVVAVYVNGALASSATFAVTTVDAATNPFYIGNRQTFSRFFGGQASDVRLWNGALSAADIADHYLSPGDLATPTSTATLAARWKLDEGTGTTLHDVSGNANTGTLVSGTWIPPYTPYVTQPVLATGVSNTVDNVITVLQNLGLVIQ